MPVPNENTTSLASDAGSRFFWSLWDAVAGKFFAPRDDGNHNLLVALGTKIAGEDLTNDRLNVALVSHGVSTGTLFASAARTGTVSSADMVNGNARGIFLWVSVTAKVGSPSITPQIIFKNPLTGTYACPWSSGSGAITAVGDYLYYIGLDAPATAGLLKEVANVPFPLGTFAGTMIHGNGDSITYSETYLLVK